MAHRNLIVVCLYSEFTTRFIIRSALDTFLLELGCHKWTVFKSHDTARIRLQAVVWFSLSVFLASFTPDVLIVIGPIGGVTATFMITFPGI